MSGGISWTRVRVPRLLSTIFLAVYGLTALVGAAGGLLEMPLFFALPTLMTPLTWGLLAVSYVLSFTSSWTVGEVDIGDAFVTVIKRRGAAKTIPRRSIVGAIAVKRPVGDGFVSTVEIELDDGDRLTVRIHDPDHARAVVDALGFGPGGARVRVRLAKPSRRLLHLPLAAVAWIAAAAVFLVAGDLLVGHGTAIESAMMAGWSFLAMGAYLLLRRAIRPPEVLLGDEGATVTKGYRTRFFTRGDPRLASALAGPLVDGPRLVEVLRAESERAASTAVSVERFAAFAREERPLEDWRAELRRRMDASSYRAVATTADEAAAALRSPLATSEQRIGAALALRIAGEPPERIRVAVEASVDEDVRLALEAVVRGDDPAVERVMRRLR